MQTYIGYIMLFMAFCVLFGVTTIGVGWRAAAVIWAAGIIGTAWILIAASRL